MSTRIALNDLQEQLPDVVNRAGQDGEEFIIERNGKDYAVLVSARAWRRRTVGKRLDERGSAYRVAPDKQARIEDLLARKEVSPLTPAEPRQLNTLLRECDEIMLRRARSIDDIV